MRRLLATGLLASVALFLLGMAGPAGAQATPTTKAAAVVQPAVVYIESHWTARVWSPATTEYTAGYLSSEPFTFANRCTGFVLNPDGYIATAGHCVDPGKEQGASYDAIVRYGIWQFLDIRDMSHTEENFQWVWDTFDPIANWRVNGTTKGSKPQLEVFVQHGVAAGGVTTGETMGARVIDFTSWGEGDVAILKVETSDMPSLELAPRPSIEVGTEVLSVGYPGAADEVTDATYTPTFQDGQINSQKTRDGGVLPVYEISSEMTGGMSGGPTTDLQGRVVGINSYGDISGSYNFISPVSLLHEMMVANGVENRLGPVDTAYRAGLQAFFAGDMNRAAFEFERATGLSPSHQLAQEYLQKARAKGGDPALGNPASQESEGGGSMMIIIIAAAAVLLLGGGAAFFLMRRRGRGAPSPAPVQQSISVPEAVPTNGHQEVPANGHAEEPVLVTAPIAEEPAPAAPKRARTTTRKAAAPKAQASRFCPECGSQAGAQAKFCESCGHRF